MAPTIQAQHVVAVTIPTIAVLFFTYLWYKKRSNSVTRNRNDPGGGGGTSRKRTRQRNTTATVSALSKVGGNGNRVMNSRTPCVENENFPEAMKNAIQKVIRDLETASPIQEICSDSEENQTEELENLSPVTQLLEMSPSNAASSSSGYPRDQENSEESNEFVGTNFEETAYEDAEVKNIDILDDEKNLEEKNMNEEYTEIETKCNLQSTLTSSTDGINETCIISVRKCALELEKIELTNSNRCAIGRQFDCKSNAKHQESLPTANSADDNLDVAMLKLESMRISDKSKRKQVGANVKRQNYLVKDDDSISTIATNNNGNNSALRSKSPASVLSHLATSPTSAKSRKRKSKRRSKIGQNDNNKNDSVAFCKSSNNETTVEVTVSKTVACDANKSVDSFVGRTNNTSKDTKHGTRKWTSDSEKTYLSSHKNDRLSCNLKESYDCDLKVIENHQKDCDNERDSANHSPVDTILDCQSVQFSDAHSEGSSDSGKGCSEGAVSPSPQTPAGGSSISGDQNVILWYQFVIPQEHVGKLIGKLGQFISTIKANSNTRIFIKEHPISFKKKICALEGTQQEINKALELIRIRFPEERYPDVTLEEFPITQPIACPLRPELFQLDLVEGVNNDVVISSVVTAGHLFLQQPMHPTYQSLTLLNINMNQVYNSPEAPLILKPAKDNIVAAPAMGGWYRAQITAVDKESEMCDVRFLDYGGYLTLSSSCLRAVRADFLTLPFQAVECLLANIAPINETWCEDAKLVVQGLTYGQILQAQVYDYTPEGTPLILLYVVHGSQVILINDELVARGFAYSTVANENMVSDDCYVYS